MAPRQKSEMALEVAHSQEQAPEGTKPPDTVLQTTSAAFALICFPSSPTSLCAAAAYGPSCKTPAVTAAQPSG